MSSKVKRKVTVENTKDNDDQPRRPSVFERLGPGAVNVAAQPADRHNRAKSNEKCLNFFRTGNCAYGNSCRYKHEAAPSSRKTKGEKETSESKDFRIKGKSKREEDKVSRTDSTSPKRKTTKRNSSRSRKGDHESKIKSTVVVTRPRSPSTVAAEAPESKKKGDGTWEEDSDDWPMDAAQLDYKEELTLERKRQQLQRELELELQKEKLLGENVTITKTVAFSGSSSSSTTSDSGSISSSSESSSSSSDEESNSSSSSSSSSSSGARAAKLKRKKATSRKEPSKPSTSREGYDKPAKKSRTEMGKKARSVSLEAKKSGRRKSRDKKNASPVPSPKKKHQEKTLRRKGPRTPSPVQQMPHKQRQWTQSSSADSRTADAQRRGKRHKKKKDAPRIEKHRGDHLLPPPLSSPNRMAVLSPVSIKKAKGRDDSTGRGRHRKRDTSLPKTTMNILAQKTVAGSRYAQDERLLKGSHNKKEDMAKNIDNRDRSGKRSKFSPKRDTCRGSPSPHRDRYDAEPVPVSRNKGYAIPDKSDRRHSSVSPAKIDRRRLDIKREVSPAQYREQHRSNEVKGKRYASPDLKKEKSRDHGKDLEPVPWQSDHRKPSSSSNDRRSPELRGRQELRSQPAHSDRSRERDHDRKKSGKKRDMPSRAIEDVDRTRIVSPRRSPSSVHSHHATREIEALGSMYDTDLPSVDREYGYGYDSYMNERLLPTDYESDILRPPTSSYTAEVYPEGRYRRGNKDRYDSRDAPHSLTGRSDDYLSELPIEDRPYDDRWQRTRGREGWDPYATVPADPLPPHVAAALDEDRYGMPRRRRASPEWQRNRLDDRDSNQSHNRPLNRGSGPQIDTRSKSPPLKSGRPALSDRSGRRDSSKQREDSKSSDDRKSSRKDRKKDDTEEKSSLKDKPISSKRPHSPSPSPSVKSKKRRTEIPAFDLLKYHGADTSPHKDKKRKEETKGYSKPISKTQKPIKQEEVSPKHASTAKEKIESSSKHSSDSRSKDEKKLKKNEMTQEEYDFSTLNDVSDVSDDDDDLLTRDDFPEFESSTELPKTKHRSEEDSSYKRRDRQSNRDKSRDISMDDISHSKDGKKEDTKDISRTFSPREDTATDVEEYITESVDYEPISDEELDIAMMEESEDSLIKPVAENEKSEIVDVLDVNWSALMNENGGKKEFVAGLARRRFKACHVLARIGISQALAGPLLTQKITETCQKQLDEEKEGEEPPKKFELEHPVAAFHMSVSRNKKERRNLFNNAGPFRRALCARRDLHIRQILCKPTNKLTAVSTISYTPQFTLVDKELYKQSLELLKKPSALQTLQVC